MKKYSNSGFTLVEMAIVMIIIGLLIGGVLKGQELIRNAIVVSTVSEIRNIDLSMGTFFDTYGALPGDIPPSIIGNVPDCGGCQPGDGNGVIGDDDTRQPIPANSEILRMWTHLQNAGMLHNLDVDESDNGVPGEGTPSSSAGDITGYYIGYHDGGPLTTSATNNNTPFLAGHILTTREGTTTNATGLNQCSMNTKIAGNIDRKMDDGNPNAGIVQSGNVNGVSGPDRCELDAGTGPDDEVYNEAAEIEGCCLMIALEN